MGNGVARKLIESHLVSGKTSPGNEIGLHIDQTLTQDATGTMVMLELEALELDRVQTEASVQYVDHNLLQTDDRNMTDHLFLQSACRRFGVWYSRPGNGVSHPTHMQRFGRPGTSMVGSDSHTCAAGSLGMLALGVGGIDVAMAMAGEPVHLPMPQIWGIRLDGELPEWVSAKDVILELLRRHGVAGGRNRILEYHGAGLDSLSAMDRHVIANMGAELGATTSVFPSDQRVLEFLRAQDREQDFTELLADSDCEYDVEDAIALDQLEPLIAAPQSPGNVVPVAEVGDVDVHQVVVGSSANPGLRDFAIVAATLRDQVVHPQVSLDINPTSRQILADLTRTGAMTDLIHAGARIHQAGCMGCIGMGQAPAAGVNSLRTFPRNFPGRSGTADDAVWLCSPETAVAAALTGRITDPRRLPDLLGIDYPDLDLPEVSQTSAMVLEEPLPVDDARTVELVKGSSIGELPQFATMPETVTATVAIKVGDDVSTDEILPAGARALPYRSDIARLAEYAFHETDPGYVARARHVEDHAIIAGSNYGQGSSREHAALAPRYLGLRLVVAKSYSRIHWHNLINFGVVPLEFASAADYEHIDPGDELVIERVHDSLSHSASVIVDNHSKSASYRLTHRLSSRQAEILNAGGAIPYARTRRR
jgi:aconitate hydratase